MNNKIKDISLLALCVGFLVPIWGVFHGDIGIKNGWAGFASAALFFAAGHKLKESANIAAGHLMGVGWGLSMFFLLNNASLQHYDSKISFFCILCFLGILAVIITHLGINLISHLPSVFCGWAITVGSLGGVPVKDWGMQPLDIILALLAGIFILGVGISQMHIFLAKRFKIIDGEVAQKKENTRESKDTVSKSQNSHGDKKLLKYINSYKPETNQGQSAAINDISDIKSELIDLKKYLSKKQVGVVNENDSDTTVKIVAICGSPHKKGSTIAYIRKALEAAESVGGVKTELIELAGKDIKPCMGCKTDKCYGRCKIDDDMQDVYPILRDCDGIIIGSPSYFGTFTGQLKVFLDRLRVMRHTDFQLGNKVIAPLSTAGRRHGGQEITNLDLIQAMMRHNTIVVNDSTAVCQLGATGWSHTFDDPNKKADDDEYGMETAEGIGRRVAEIAKVIKSSSLAQSVYKYNAKIGKR